MQPDADEVRRQLERMLASDTFAAADRLSRFLRHVVQRTLAGEGDQLKEYSVGVGVFDRDEQYDPRTDAIVRVEASRLRAKIEEYYRSAGAADSVVIRLPKGGYVPVFEAGPSPVSPVASSSTGQAAMPPGARRWMIAATAAVAVVVGWIAVADRVGSSASARPVSLAVLPFDVFSKDPGLEQLAARLTDGVTAEAARLGTVSVVSHTSARQFAAGGRQAREIAAALGADLLLEGTLEVTGERLRVSLRLVDGAADRKIWVADIDGRLTDLPGLARRLASAAVAAAGPRAR